ncbi:MAG: hypothetical protein U1F43_26205 [Myxococcota bacterium]
MATEERTTRSTLVPGLGIAEGYIGSTLSTDLDLYGQSIDAYNDGRTSVEDLLGGWLALSGKCPVQKRASDGTMAPNIVDALPFATTSQTLTLTTADVELNGCCDPRADGVPDGDQEA